MATMTFDTENITRELTDIGTEYIKGIRTLMEIGDIEVGMTPKDLVFQNDKMKLYHFKPPGKVKSGPILLTYALINRPYMLDLQPDRSFIRNLLKHGLDIYMIDWGYPTKVDRYLSMDDYINVYMDDCVNHICDSTGHDKVTLMGVCQGGTFSTIYSAIHPEKVQNLIPVVAPISFETNDGLLFHWAKHLNVDAIVDTYGVIPADFINEGFLMLQPFNLNIYKYVQMYKVIGEKDKLENFMRMEKWIFDSPAQAGECYRQFMKDLYQQNKMVKNELQIGEHKVNLGKITMPLLNVYASKDHIVPPASTKPLNDLVKSKDKKLYELESGHIGVFVGSRSQNELAPAIADWLTQRSNVKPTGVKSVKSVKKVAK